MWLLEWPIGGQNFSFDRVIFSIFLEHWCLIFSFSLFFIGLSGIIFSRKNLINVMISIELMLLGADLNIIFFSIFLESMVGQMFALIVIAIAAADSAVGLGILVAAFYLKRNISFESFSFLKG
jgi:NADH-quinone oxidoreductase subunit K